MLRAALAFLALVIAALVGGQLVLPRMAERRITDDLAANGEVRRVSVEAFPAVKLLFKRADRVEIEMAEASAGTGRLAKLLRRTRGARRLEARVDLVRLGPLQLRGVALHKDHARLRGEASVSEADLAAALPRGLGSLTLFRDSRVQVEEVGSRLGADGFTLSAAGRLDAS